MRSCLSASPSRCGQPLCPCAFIANLDFRKGCLVTEIVECLHRVPEAQAGKERQRQRVALFGADDRENDPESAGIRPRLRVAEPMRWREQVAYLLPENGVRDKDLTRNNALQEKMAQDTGAAIPLYVNKVVIQTVQVAKFDLAVAAAGGD